LAFRSHFVAAVPQNDFVSWTPHDAQQVILNAMPLFRYLVLVCARRFGKTELMLANLERRAWENPGDYVYIAPTFKQAKRIAWRKLKRMFPASHKPSKQWKNEAELWVQNSRGGRILLLGADDPDGLRGEGWKGAVVDEFADIDPDIFDSVIRPALSDFRGFCHFIGTPKGRNHFYEWFIKDKDHHDPHYTDALGEYIEINDQVKSFHFVTGDNPHIHPAEIEQAKKDLSLEMFKQEYLASFENYAGLVYREWMAKNGDGIGEPIFNDKQQVIAYTLDGIRHELKPWYEFYIGLDTGRTSAASFLAVDDYGNEIIFDEVYDVDGLCKDISTQIKQKSGHIKIKRQVIDSASQMKAEYQNQGFVFENSHKDPMGAIDIIRRKDKEGKMIILSNCKATIKEKNMRRWNERSKIKREPIKKDDHVINAIDYIQTTFLAHQPDDLEYWQKRVKSDENRYLDKHSLAARTKQKTRVKIEDLS